MRRRYLALAIGLVLIIALAIMDRVPAWAAASAWITGAMLAAAAIVLVIRRND